MSVYNQSNTTFNFPNDSDDTVNGGDDVVSVGDDSTLNVKGSSDVVFGSFSTLTMNGLNNSLNGVGNQVTVADNSQLTVAGGGNTISQSHGYLTISGSNGWADRISGTVLELTVLGNSHLYLTGSQNDVYLGADALVFDTGDNTNFFGSDDRIYMSGATVGGDQITGNHNKAFVAANSQLLLYGDDTIVRSDDHSSLAITGTGERLIGADFFATATSGSEVWIGGNGVSGVDDTLTASKITATIGGNSNVILHGDDDIATVALDSRVYFVGTGLTAHVGKNANLIINGSGETSALDTLTGGSFSVTVATPSNVEMNSYEATATLVANVALSVERSGNVIHAGASDSIAILSGVSNQVYLGVSDVIANGGFGSVYDVAGNVGATTISNFGHGAIIDLLNGAGGYATAQAAFAALTSDGAGGLKLGLGADGAIDFAGASGLSAANFKVG